MIELERHIEILLLSNDCVIVPGLGGFMTHHVEARYDERDSMFLPPLRTLGFNPQLNINDSLLVQSYIEAYDISYPEALQRIDDEVNELRQHVENEGSYELNDIGVLSLNEDGNYVFTPCEAGILTPSLYGLSSFEIFPIKAKAEQPQPVVVQEPEPAAEPTAKIVGIDTETAESETDESDIEEDQEEDDGNYVRIKYSWIRNTVAIAAILIAIFILALPTGKTEMMQRTISNLNNGILFGMMSEDTNTSKIEIKKADLAKVVVKDSVALRDTLQRDTVATPETEPVETAGEVRKTYCIVLASHVSARNANDFIERLGKKGFDRVEIFERNNVRRVIYGYYPSEEAAQDDLHLFHGLSETSEAWVMSL